MALDKVFVATALVLSSCAAVCAAAHSQGQGQAKGVVTKPAAACSGHSAKNTTQQILIEKEKLSWELAVKRNIPSYKALHAPDYFTVSGNGVADRANSEASTLDPNVTFSHYELSRFIVHFVGTNAALITYHARAAGFDHGKQFDSDSYATSLWMKRDGKWLNVFYQASPETQ